MTPELEALAVLAARVEAMTGPDREVDADIRLAVLGDCQYGVITGNRHQGIAPAYLSSYVAAYRTTLTADDALHDDVVPRYTASLDAAMTLIVPDEYWRLGNDGEGPDVAMFKATVTSHDDQADLRFHDAVAATPALALTAAALRAITPTQNHKGPHDE